MWIIIIITIPVLGESEGRSLGFGEVEGQRGVEGGGGAVQRKGQKPVPDQVKGNLMCESKAWSDPVSVEERQTSDLTLLKR